MSKSSRPIGGEPTGSSSTTLPTLSLAKCITTDVLENAKLVLVTQHVGDKEVPIEFTVHKISCFIYGLVPTELSEEDYRKKIQTAENQFNAHTWLIVKKESALSEIKTMDNVIKWVKQNGKICIVAPKALQQKCRGIQEAYSGPILEKICCCEEEIMADRFSEPISPVVEIPLSITNPPDTFAQSSFLSIQLLTNPPSTSWLEAVWQFLSWTGDKIISIFNQLASCLCNHRQNLLQAQSVNNPLTLSPSKEDRKLTKSEPVEVRKDNQSEPVEVRKDKQPESSSSSYGEMIFKLSLSETVVSSESSNSDSDIEIMEKNLDYKNLEKTRTRCRYTPSSRSPHRMHN